MAGTNEVGDLEYSYDADSRVIEKTGSLASTSIPSVVTGNTFNLANEMTSFNGTPLTYDLNGNLLTDGTNTYTWDARNHLSTLTGSGTLPTTGSFIYDALGRRFEKTINQQSTAFLYDGLNPVQELAPAGLGQFAPTATMLTGLGIDELFQRTDVNGAQSFITDTLGSTLALTNAAGSISTSYTYEPFGNVSINPSATNTNPYQFTGRERDATGIDYYRDRYYSPSLSRFVSEDPLGPDGNSRNLYAYTDDDPVNHSDPSGDFTFPVPPLPPPLLGLGPVLAGTIGGIVAAPVLILFTPTEIAPEPDIPSPPKSKAGCGKPDCKKATPFHLRQAGIASPHQFKTQWGALPLSAFEICACNDGSIVIKATGMCGQSGPEIPTDRRWK